MISRLATIAILVIVGAACGSAPESTTGPRDLAPATGPDAHVTGGGHYLLELAGEHFPGKFSVSAMQFADGNADGHFHYRLDLGDGILGVIEGGAIDFHGRVICVTSDLAEGRAWVGGVVTQNTSTQPFYRDDATTQVGKDIWFRVLDPSDGVGPDRTTFVGFEGGAGIITSEEYCAVMPWPDDNARTHPVTAGNVTVHD